MPHSDRLSVLRTVLARGHLSTQDELVEELRARKFEVTQSTISRDLGRLRAVKVRDAAGRVTYRLPESAPLRGLVLDITHNGSLIVIHTTPGSANLLARQIDQARPEGVLGTIAGDDTIFVAPASVRRLTELVDTLGAQFG